MRLFNEGEVAASASRRFRTLSTLAAPEEASHRLIAVVEPPALHPFGMTSAHRVVVVGSFRRPLSPLSTLLEVSRGATRQQERPVGSAAAAFRDRCSSSQLGQQ